MSYVSMRLVSLKSLALFARDGLGTYPSWRFREEEHQGNCENSEEALQSQRESELYMAVDV